MANETIKPTDDVVEVIRSEFGEVLKAIPEIAKRQKMMLDAFGAEDADGIKAHLKKQDDAIADLLARVQRGAKLDRDTGIRIDKDGVVRPAASRELCQTVVNVWKEKMLTEEKVRDLGGTVGSAGGFLFAPQYVPELLQIIYSYGVFRQNALVLPMSLPTMTFPSLNSGVGTFWVDENAAATTSEPSFAQVSMTAKTLVALTAASQQLLEDAQIDVGQLLIDLFAREIARVEDVQGFLGTGAGGQQPFTGVMKTASVNVVQLPTGNTSFTNVTADALLDMSAAIPTPMLAGAKFYMHRTILEIVRKQKDSTGNYIFQPPTAAAPGTIWGWPYELAEALPAAGSSANNTAFIVFGNLRNAFLGDRHQLEAARSNEVGFTKLQTYLRLHERIAIQVAQATAFSILKTSAS